MFANFAIGWRDVQCQGIVSEIQILDSIESAGMKDGAMIFVVSNPVDILTYLAIERLDLPVNKVVGLGTVLSYASAYPAALLLVVVAVNGLIAAMG